MEGLLPSASITKVRVVSSAPISVTNMTGLRIIIFGLSMAKDRKKAIPDQFGPQTGRGGGSLGDPLIHS